MCDINNRSTLVGFSLLAALTLSATAEAKELDFSGGVWKVKDSGGEYVGPGTNLFSEKNAWVDGNGYLHLRIQREADGSFTCSEVILQESFGYGTYRFHVGSPVYNLDQHVVLGLFTWSNQPAYANREIDIEFSRWSKPGSENLHYSVQPDLKKLLLVETDWARSTHAFTWRSGRVDFESYGLDGAGKRTKLATWRASSSTVVPTPGDEQVRLNLWLNQGTAPDVDVTEVIIEKFEFVP